MATPNYDWSDLRVFLAACRTGSLSRAASELGVSLSTVSRRITVLEGVLGEPLFARTPSGLQLSPAAIALRPHAEAVERAAVAGMAAVSTVDPGLAGEVRVALPADMLILVLLPRLRPFLLAHPRICLSLEHGRRQMDLTRREADIAVRASRPERGEELVYKRIRTVAMGVFAARSVLDPIDDPSDPTQHRWIAETQGGGASWVEAVSGGRIALRCTSPHTVRHAACAGLGTAVMPEIFGELSPSLARVPIEPPPPLDLYLIVHRAIRHAPAVNAVWTELTELLAQGDREGDLEKLRAGISNTTGPIV